MTQDEFTALLMRCTVDCVAFCRGYVIDVLPDAVLYTVRLNQSCDVHPLHDDEVVFPEDSSVPPGLLCGRSAQQTADLLWREGRIPEWVDMSVVDASSEHTHVGLLCCGRFTANAQRWYYAHRGNGPFGIKSPVLPVKSNGNAPVKFRLNRHGGS